MPTAPSYGDDRVRSGAVPNTSQSPTADVEAFGGGASLDKLIAAGNELGNTVLKTAGQMYAAEVQKADEVRVLDGAEKLTQLETGLNKYAATKKGQDAFGLPDEIDEQWTKGVEEIDKSLSNDRQRLALRKMSISTRASLDSNINRHVAAEAQSFDAGKTKSYIENEQNAAQLNFLDAKRIGLSIQRQRTAIGLYGRRNGQSQEEIDNNMDSAASDTHYRVMEQMLANGEVEIARNYYDANKEHIMGKEATKFPEYIDSYAKRLEVNSKAQKEEVYDQNLRTTMINMFDGKLTLSEVQRLYREDAIKEGDYNMFERKMISPDYELLRTIKFSKPSTFNNIRQAQINQEATPGEIDRMILAATNSKELTMEDGKYLLTVNKGLPASPKDAQVTAQASSIKDFGNRYFSDSTFDQYFGDNKKEKEEKIEGLVSEFYRRVDSENATGARIDEIAREVMSQYVKIEHPEVNRLEDLPHIIITTSGRIKRILNPDQKTKLKAQYKLVPIAPTSSAPDGTDVGTDSQ